MDTWPVSLQQRLSSSNFQAKFGKTTLRTDMDIGPAKVRSRFTDGIDVYTCEIFLDFSEYADLSIFFKTTLNNGANQFLFDDPFTGSATAFRFVEEPVVRALGGRTFQVGMTWEKMP